VTSSFPFPTGTLAVAGAADREGAERFALPAGPRVAADVETGVAVEVGVAVGVGVWVEVELWVAVEVAVEAERVGGVPFRAGTRREIARNGNAVVGARER
jgi:hypothetical protein